MAAPCTLCTRVQAMSAPTLCPSAFSQELEDMEEMNLTLPHRWKLSPFPSPWRGWEPG